MKIQNTRLEGVLILEPRRFSDNRGHFAETWNRRTLAENGIETDWVQDNHSLSAEAGTVRGLHFQAPPHAQTKLVRCGRGQLFDVAVDIRKGSPTFGEWVGVDLSPENGLQLLIPAGFAHGFVTRAPDTEIIYKCSDYYSSAADGAVLWNDPDIGIDWGLGDRAPVLSEKDEAAPRLVGLNSPFTYHGDV